MPCPYNIWVGKRHCRVLYPTEIRRRQCRPYNIWVGKRHCRVLYPTEMRRRQCRVPTIFG